MLGIAQISIVGAKRYCACKKAVIFSADISLSVKNPTLATPLRSSARSQNPARFNKNEIFVNKHDFMIELGERMDIAA